MNKMSQIKAAVCLPLYQAAPDTVMKKEDLMDDTEKRYLNKKNPDFQRTISDGKSAMRKEEEWAVQQAVEEGLLTRIERGYYTITPAGRCWLGGFFGRNCGRRSRNIPTSNSHQGCHRRAAKYLSGARI